MELNEQINKIRKMMGLNEYIARETISLRDYLSLSDQDKMRYLPYEYHWFFEDFLDETGEEFNPPKETRPSDYADEPDVEVDAYDNSEELITSGWLEKNNPQLYQKFAQYLFRKINYNELPINDAEYPAWSYFDNKPSLVKNQWLIHFTDDAESVALNGFKYGVDDMTKLGLTTRLGEFDKKYGGYNFAYTLSDFPRYAKSDQSWRNEYKYGKQAVVFNASGIKVWHHGDQEPQVIFYGNTARNIIPITQGENAEWGIYQRNGRLLYQHDDLKQIVNWLVNNYTQYRKVLTWN